jgi:4-amino-4-deoxy-L-arabinose transferase-like glycosyltransferase
LNRSVPLLGVLGAALLLSWCVGMLGRGYWTPDEPREADIAWRMSWQTDKAVPLLAGEAFCEKPPLTYWLAGAAMNLFGAQAWAARLPNLLYALVTALAIGALALRSAGPVAGAAAAAAIGSFLLSYQTAIWLATDAPLLAANAVALLGLYTGFYAANSRERTRGYLLMHAALAAGFLCKSAAAWMVPALALLTLIVWEKRWRELLRSELYAGLLLQAAVILTWVWFVYAGADGTAHLKVFFYNNLVGRFVGVDAPAELQYASAHRNTPGKYLLELPLYLWPWTLLVAAAARHAWLNRNASLERQRTVRFALAVSLPALLLLSVAATARNIYFAPALPGFALLLAWWAREMQGNGDRWDWIALRASAIMLLAAAAGYAVVLTLVGIEALPAAGRGPVGIATEGGFGALTGFIAISTIGLAACAYFARLAWVAAGRKQALTALSSLLFAYLALLIAPSSQLYRQVDHWQNLASIGSAVRHDATARPLILFAPDETTRAFVDMYTRTSVLRVPGPINAASVDALRTLVETAPRSLVLVQLDGRKINPRVQALATRLGVALGRAAERVDPAWLDTAQLRISQRYELPNGRRYALLERAP